MSNPYVGEVRLVGFNFAPAGWLPCSGQTVAISEFSTLYNLIGTTYGGNGQTVFGIPDLRGRVPIHQGSNGTTNYVLGQFGGAEMVLIGLNQYPAHNHALFGSTSSGGSGSPVGNVAGTVSGVYTAAAPSIAMNAGALTPSAGGTTCLLYTSRCV